MDTRMHDDNINDVDENDIQEREKPKVTYICGGNLYNPFLKLIY
jgi:hypothetical protein